jgi:hypothetical protein
MEIHDLAKGFGSVLCCAQYVHYFQKLVSLVNIYSKIMVQNNVRNMVSLI